MGFRKKQVSAALSLSLLISSMGGMAASVSAASNPATVAPPAAPAWGHFVDNYKNNSTVNMAVYSNPTIGILSGFSQLWTPGTTWDTGTKLNSSVLDANIQKVIDLAASRTPAEANAAYFDDRRKQSYSIIDGLGSLTDVYRTNAGAVTTINEIPADATTVKYDDGGTDAGSTSSSLGSIVSLVKTIRGNYSSTTPAKNYYSYKRPYRWSSPSIIVPALVPAISTTPQSDGGFPSGHTNAGYLSAIAMAYAIPERFQELLTRASELGNNRILSGMHSPLDVMGGRVTATALSAAILSDPDNSLLKKTAYNDAHSLLLTQTGTAEDRFSNYTKNKQDYTERLTYGFSPIHSTTEPAVVPKGAEVLLETRLPYLDDTQRRWVLATTELPSGYPVLDDPEGWGRLNLFAAADGYGAFASDVTVTMDANQGGFNALDRWRNDISGTGSLTKEGTGTLKLQGNNSYSGGTLLNEGTLEGNSNTAFGTGDVANNGGTLIHNVPGPLTIGGNFSQSASGTLELGLSSVSDLLDIKGKVQAGGTLRLNFLNNYVPDGVITLITHGKDQRSGEFSSVETEGLPSQYKMNVIYNANSIQLAVDTDAPRWPADAKLTGSSITSSDLTLNWPAAVDKEGVVSYSVYRDSTLLGTVSGATYSYKVTGLTQGTTYSFSVVAYDLTDNSSSPLKASLSTISSSSPGGIGPVATPAPSPVPSASPSPVSSPGTDNGKQSLSVTATADSSGKAEATLSDSQITDLLTKISSSAAAKISVQLNVQTVDNAKSLGVTLSKDAVSKLFGSKAAEVELVTQFGSMTFNKAALESLKNASGDSIRIGIAPAGTAGLSSEAASLVGTRPVLEFTVQSGALNLTSFGNGSLKISIPFTLAQGEDANAIAAYYIDNSGKPNAVAKSGYNQSAGTVTLLTNHLSKYAVGYHKISFSDTSGHWGSSYITYLAAHHIISGTSANTFAPNTNITRAEFAKMLAGLANADVSGYSSSTFTDIKAGDWYLPYVAWAAGNNIVNGAGNHQFNPNAAISREEISVMIGRYADLAGYSLPDNVSNASFADSSSVSAWAVDAVTALQKAGILSGKGNNTFDPKGGATRAEAAKIMTVLLQGMIQ
ncbi:S-layer homology domain-containing protein [Paenibacillus sp. sgz5001063]|uniref:S-layer homology domain-containing protein n=1 Tax=Paenibacillus sp. sgz5001063 TaxID=3242474 RepID=UPI0036D408FC